MEIQGCLGIHTNPQVVVHGLVLSLHAKSQSGMKLGRNYTEYCLPKVLLCIVFGRCH